MEKVYTNGEVDIVWKPDLCKHSGICFKGLSVVFDPREKPWIRPHHASTDEIVNQIRKCPSGALSYRMKEA